MAETRRLIVTGTNKMGKSVVVEDVAKMQEWFFKEVGDPEARGDTSRQSLMHKTPTVDYIVLLSGNISLVLDEGDPVELKPLDAVAQRGVGHSWLNTGNEAAPLVAVMVGGE